MTRDDLIDLLSDEEQLALLEGPEFDAALVGLAERYGQPRIACYDYDKVITILKRQGMSDEEAVEWYDYNLIGAWMGETTPIFLHRISPARSTRAGTATSSATRRTAKPDAPWRSTARAHRP